MKIRQLLLLNLLLLTGFAKAQSLTQQIQTALGRLQEDSNCKYASISLTVLDAKTGETVFASNPNMGLATASTLKVITSVTAFNILGKEFQYQTQLRYTGSLTTDGTLNGDVIIQGGGDPTLGSWRWDSTKENVVLDKMVAALKQAGIKRINGRVIGDDSLFGTQSIPDGWIWQDLGNYYGAGTSALCWRENSFDIKLRTGTVDSPVEILRAVPATPYLSFRSELLTASSGTGDRSYAYLPVGSKAMYLRGSYATDQSKKSISVALPDAAYDAAYRLEDTLKRLGISISGQPESTTTLTVQHQPMPTGGQTLATLTSPELSSIVYWLNKKSINLYAEQLLKTIAWKSGRRPTTLNGVDVVQHFWRDKGIDIAALNIYDGSGLSPGDRVTTLTMARVLQSAVGQPWYNDLYNSLPIYNNMHMKSGTIADVLAYAGYQTHDGRQLCFSIMVNNYSGGTGAMREKMFKVLDALK
ncbi:D-alanyl-D-alanine carboxypeptidase/D-alanyl-D-alanine-endopeptidase [Mucilaginibacter koreensis]